MRSARYRNENRCFETLPDLDFRMIRGAGHWVMYEAPDAFNEIVLEMLG